MEDNSSFLTGGTAAVTRCYTYDTFDRPETIVYKEGEEVKDSYSYTYDKNNNITSETMVNNYPPADADKVDETRTYTYNELDQLGHTNIDDRIGNGKDIS